MRFAGGGNLQRSLGTTRASYLPTRRVGGWAAIGLGRGSRRALSCTRASARRTCATERRSRARQHGSATRVLERFAGSCLPSSAPSRRTPGTPASLQHLPLPLPPVHVSPSASARSAGPARCRQVPRARHGRRVGQKWPPQPGSGGLQSERPRAQGWRCASAQGRPLPRMCTTSLIHPSPLCSSSLLWVGRRGGILLILAGLTLAGPQEIPARQLGVRATHRGAQTNRTRRLVSARDCGVWISIGVRRNGSQGQVERRGGSIRGTMARTRKRAAVFGALPQARSFRLWRVAASALAHGSFWRRSCSCACQPWCAGKESKRPSTSCR